MHGPHNKFYKQNIYIIRIIIMSQENYISRLTLTNIPTWMKAVLN